MKIRNYKLSIEDFKSEAEWIKTLINPINNFMSDTSFALNNGLSISDNLRQEIKELDHIESTSSYPLIFTPKLGNPKGLSIIHCKEVASSPIDLTSAPFINYEIDAQGKVRISSITNLVSGKRYLIRIHIIYE